MSGKISSYDVHVINQLDLIIEDIGEIYVTEQLVYEPSINQQKLSICG